MSSRARKIRKSKVRQGRARQWDTRSNGDHHVGRSLDDTSCYSLEQRVAEGVAAAETSPLEKLRS